MIFGIARARAAGLVLLAAGLGCSTNSGSGPSTDPVTTADLQAAIDGNSALNLPYSQIPLRNLVALYPSIVAVFPTPPAPAVGRLNPFGPLLSLSPEDAVRLYLSRLLAPRTRHPSFALRGQAATVPANLLGKTFEWDVNGSAYVDQGTAGAPADAVRFILYALDATGAVDETNLTEVAKLDIQDGDLNGPAGSGVLNFSLFQGGTSYGTWSVTHTEGATLVSGAGSGNASTSGGVVTFNISPFEVANDSSHVRIDVAQFNVDLNHDGTAEHFFVEDGTETACTGQSITVCSEFQVSFSQLKQGVNDVYFFGGTVDQVNQVLTGANLAVTLAGQPIGTITSDNQGVITIRGPGGQPITAASNSGQFISLLFLDAALVDQGVSTLVAPAYQLIPNGDLIHLPY